jgi:hypothetical protein
LLTKTGEASEYQVHIFDALQYGLRDIAGRSDPENRKSHVSS